ncbi:hypothetical protein Krac_3997 [Ktedonobacter racemifer DSM 44963]|uniref:Uncharacterized protein n=2 Tax=Ktedonobacter TaxID=363276 RepID=D6TXN3_KTERA|nr:hypothetical protein Krac_3997 [Ktedonobacter racemifer DSM 44963]
MSIVAEKPKLHTNFLKQGYLIQENFVSPEQCTHFLDLVA